MASSPLLFLSLLLFAPLALAGHGPSGPPVPHGGPLLTRSINLSLIWYGPFGRVQKRVIRTFISSLNYNGGANLEPQVSSWWRVVESYQSFARPGPPGPAPPINVKVVKQEVDINFSVGKVLTVDFLNILAQKAAAGTPAGSLAVIFAGSGVTVQGLCMGKCSIHGLNGPQPYLVVGNPEIECPGSCAWPFFPSDYGPKGVILQPPNKNVAADAMVIALASGLAETVTNPFNNGFYSGIPTQPTEISDACPNMFGSGALPGYTGKVRIDPATGGAFNAHGPRGRKYLLPAIWNPRTNSCYTPL
ncbi:protein EXORDIUM-like 2 [Punica granatum]|uniref:Uncharacterized protein n=2 Tax=Punica granatum TaxID=22663 RepID=A0A218W5S6_PUNGR|nr:protein EXORDIUM-like 2 [Punica granatum]OWM67996.1 hypothetical protein CDL15_Pgr017564 [Punica granatum]PKI60392.1 hypothetical protein CRG98_019217 [Punica granatum]